MRGCVRAHTAIRSCLGRGKACPNNLPTFQLGIKSNFLPPPWTNPTYTSANTFEDRKPQRKPQHLSTGISHINLSYSGIRVAAASRASSRSATGVSAPILTRHAVTVIGAPSPVTTLGGAACVACVCVWWWWCVCVCVCAPETRSPTAKARR